MGYLSGAVVPVLCRMEVSPGSGATTTILAPFDHVLFTNGSTLSAATVAMPASPNDGDMVRISTVSAITTLTISPSPQSAPSGLAAASGVTMCYSSNLGKWFAF